MIAVEGSKSFFASIRLPAALTTLTVTLRFESLLLILIVNALGDGLGKTMIDRLANSFELASSFGLIGSALAA